MASLDAAITSGAAFLTSFNKTSTIPSIQYLCDYYGADVEEAAAEAVVSKIEEKFPDVDVELQFGGQPVYYYIVSVE